MPGDEEQREQLTDAPVIRSFGWEDMFVPPDEDPRSQAPSVGERATLVNYLRAYRQTLELKCAGLDAKALACRSVPPSDLSLLGLVRHLADVERYWFRQVLAGEDVAAIFRTDDDRDATFSGALPERAVVAEAWAAWRDEMAFAERFVDEAPDLEVTGTLGRGGQDGSVSLREVLVHMIEEYARHCGHADFLRERIDGRIGQ
ncbi:MAG: DinB family protein [Acidimicrobiales bacterium]